jgi:flavin-dependent dehydrogenase
VVATGAPAVDTYEVDFDAFTITGRPGTAYAPRRTVLDKILIDAAAEAGAEVREGFSVQELTFDGDTVTGVRGRSGGAEVTERAKIVVGADGMHSRVARSVDAPAYNERPAYTCAYYNYWSGLDLVDADIFFGESGGLLSFPTNDGLTCIAVGTEAAKFAEFRSDIEGNYMKWMTEAAPDFAVHVRKGKAEERWIGTADTANFFRKPHGPGWALVGDAGYHKDPITGLGIMDSFRDAELLADAIDDGFAGRAQLADALAGYQQKRDEAATPMYEFTCALASGNLPPEMAQIFAPQDAATPAGGQG